MTLRRRILLLTVGVAALVLVLFAVPLVVLLRGAAVDSVRTSATDVAQGVADYVSSDPDDDEISDYLDRVNARDDSYPVAVSLADGTLVGADIPGLSGTRDPGPGGAVSGDGDGDEGPRGDLVPVSAPTLTTADGGTVVTIEVRKSGGDDRVVVLASDGRVRSRLGEQLAVLAAAALALLAVAAAAAQTVTRRLVGTLSDAAEVADAFGSGNLAERVPEDGPPEVRRVAVALNRLATRIDGLLAAERELVADLSHRLRTPLTALRLDVETLARTTDVGYLEDHVDALERTLTAVIHEARRVERVDAGTGVDVGELLREAHAYWSPLGEDQGRDVDLVVGDDLPPARSTLDDLRAAVDALLGNAIAHTDEGVAIRIVGRRAGPDDAASVVVEVHDQGAGIEPTAVRRGTSDRDSSGLGLDIARRCAEASGGRLELAGLDDERGRWTVVRLVLG